MIFKKPSALTLLFSLGFIWGTGYSIARFAMTHGVSPLGYTFWQALGPAFLLTFFIKSHSHSFSTTLPSLRYYMMCGLMGIVIPNTMMYFASPHLPAGLLAVIVNTVPIIAYPLALFLKTETFHPIRLIGVIFAVLGLMCILLPKTSLPTSDMVPWIFLSLLTPLSFAYCSVFISRYRPENSDSLTLSAGTLIVATLLLTPVVIITRSFYAFHFPLIMPDYVILLEILLSSMGYVLFFRLIHLAGPVYYSLVDTIVALTGLLWGYLIFHEKLNNWTSLAVFFILSGLLMVTQHRTKKMNTSEISHSTF